jgi:hypothetical protein
MQTPTHNGNCGIEASTAAIILDGNAQMKDLHDQRSTPQMLMHT